VAQGVGPEFRPWYYHLKKKKERKKNEATNKRLKEYCRIYIPKLISNS
jgi:hypothetical protein